MLKSLGSASPDGVTISHCAMDGIVIDMNDESTLQLYCRLHLFKNTLIESELIFHGPNKERQRLLQSLAHRLDLECEYSLATRTVKITRSIPENVRSSDYEDLDFLAPLISESERSSCPHDFDLHDNPDFDYEDALLDDFLGTVRSQEDFGTSSSFSTTPPRGAALNSLYEPTTFVDVIHPNDVANIIPTATEAVPEIISDAGQISVKRLQPHVADMPSEQTTFLADNSGIPLISKLSSRKRKNVDQSASHDRYGNRKLRVFHPADSCDDISAIHQKPPFKEIPELFEGIGCFAGSCSTTGSHINPTKSICEDLSVSGAQIEGQAPEDGSAITSPNSPSESGPTSMPAVAHRSQSALARSNSVGSTPSDRDRSAFMTQSSYGQASLGYQDNVFIFDSRSVCSSSQTSVASTTSVASAPSGRRGPLSEIARAGMNAVRKLGACWKCKFLRKTCDLENPCSLCRGPPMFNKSNWDVLGCQRGTFASNSPPIDLCYFSASNIHGRICGFLPFPSTEGSKEGSPSTDEVWKEYIEKRRKALLHLKIGADAVPVPDVDENAVQCQLIAVRRLFPSCFQDSSGRVVNEEHSPMLNSLHQFILSIGWELAEQSSSLPFPESRSQPLFTLRLLPAAARYQAESQHGFGSNQLIAQSLMCLRSCLELQRLKSKDLLLFAVHKPCNRGWCKVECTTELGVHIGSYLNELSRVVFGKKNMRHKPTSWLSTFYSFCIQSVVRKLLIAAGNPYRDYLYNPIKLFIASSGRYDPLMECWEGSSLRTKPTEGQNPNDFRSTQVAVRQSNWEDIGIESSAQYLKQLFGIDQQELSSWSTLVPPNEAYDLERGIASKNLEQPSEPTQITK